MLKLKTKFRLIIGFHMALPLVLIMYLTWETALFSSLEFQQALGMGMALVLFLSLCNPLPMGLRWMFLNQIHAIAEICSNLRHGRYSFFDLPNEPVDSRDENELLALMRDMNWMVRKIELREQELENRVEKRTRDLRQSNADLLRARDAAKASARAKGEFLSTMGHEIRTPMNAVIGYTDLLLKTDPDPTQKEYLKVIRTASGSLLKIINDILDFSKMDAGKLSLEIISVDLEKLFEEILDLFRHEVELKGLDLSLTLGKGIPRQIQGDPLRLQQILINLVSNAVKFTSEGEIRIRVESPCPGEFSDIDTLPLMISVTDTGIGMDPATLEQLFVPFSQADSATTRHFGGTGLGLAISGKLARLMGGNITAKSNPGRGSCFTLALAVHPSAQDGAVEFRARSLTVKALGTGTAEDDGKTEKTSVPPPAAVFDLLQRLKVQVEANSFTARELFRELNQGLSGTGFEADARRVEDRLKQFDFKAAGQALETLTQTLEQARG